MAADRQTHGTIIPIMKDPNFKQITDVLNKKRIEKRY